MINEEVNYYVELAEQIVKRFPNVTCLKDLVNRYQALIT
jgi:hypothetical protein